MGKSKRTILNLFLIALLGLASCGQSAQNKQVPENKQISKANLTVMHNNQELWTMYSKADSIFHVKRLVSTDTGYLLLTYDINTSEPEAAYQTFIGKELIAGNSLKKTKAENASFNWTPFRSTLTLFVQLQPVAFKDEMAALEKRQQIEQLIDNGLKSQHSGSWIAGDLGPGGANMLFEVQNIDKANEVIQTILSKNGLDKTTVIGRRIKTAENDWFYEVVYPINYSGKFVTM